LPIEGSLGETSRSAGAEDEPECLPAAESGLFRFAVWPASALSRIPNQISDADPQRVRDNFECLQGHIALAALDLAHVRAVKAAPFGEDILVPALPFSQCPNLGSDLLLDVLHQEQFGGTLALTILVITSDITGRQ
jgi:hypothetical protein